MTWTIAAFYRFTRIDEPAALRDRLVTSFEGLTLCGTLLLAEEGFNGTLAGDIVAIDAARAALSLQAGDVRLSETADKPFRRLKIKIKREIITLRRPEADPQPRCRRICRCRRLEHADRRSGRAGAGYAQPLRDGRRHLQGRDRSWPRQLRRVSRFRRAIARPRPPQANRHVLHRRHTLREGPPPICCRRASSRSFT